MKKTLLLLASAAMLLVGCAKEKFSPEAGDAEMVNMTVSALVQGEELTRAAVDEDGKGVNANRCIMVLYYGDQVYGRYEAPVSGYKATFDVKVPAKRKYNAVFWADCAAEDGGDLYYNTADLTNITLKSDYIGNDDKRDAFFHCEEYTVENKSQSFTAELTRPFAQINVISKDIKDLRLAELYPQKVNLSFSAATSFNAMSGECGAAEAIAYEADVYKSYDSTKEQLTLSMDYLFAGDRSAVDIDFKAPTEGELKVEHNFSNIPYQRNYRTNIVGNLLTADAHWDVTINPKWNEPDEEVKFVEAGSVAAANEAFANGATSVKITSVGEEATLYLPQTTEEVTIDFANPDKDVTVKYGSTPTKAAGDKPAAVNIATNDVTKFVVSGISNIVWLAGNQAALANALNNAVAGHTVALSNDITMTENWVSVSRGSNTPNFDGRNHAIINMTIKTQEESYAGLFSTIENHVILQNVTFRNALIDIPASVGDNARGGILVGHMYPSDVINCHVEGATIKAHQKIGGLIGYAEGEAANQIITIKNCSVKDVTLSSNVAGSKTVAGVGGLIGHLVLSGTDLITVENNFVENITITDSQPIIGVYNYDDYGQYLPHVFIGNACQNYKGEEAVSESKHSIVLENNRILGTNTELSTCIYSSEYFGWGGNAEDNPSWKGKIYIDGQEWTPNYPFKNVTTGKGYATLDAALTALKASETLEIWEAGEYAVNSINTPENTTIDAKVDGVIFNHTAGSISSHDKEGRTIKNITLNVGVAAEQFLHIANVVNCTFNGLFYPHGTVAFTGCTFNAPGYEYCMWTKGSDVTFKSCTFNTNGKAVNVYGTGTHTYEFEDCVFNATDIPSGKGKAAIFIKEGVDWACTYNVIIKDCQANYERPYDQLDPGDISYSKSVLWNVERGGQADQSSVTVSIDDVKVYPFCSKDADGNYHIVNADGLLQFHDLYAAGKVAYTAKVYLENDIDFTGKTWTALEWHADKATKGFALFDGQNHTIKNFTVSGQGMFSRWACTSNIGATPYFKDIVFDGAKNVTSSLNVSLFCGQTYQNAKIENVTIKNSQFEGTYKVAPFVGTVYDENATGPTLTLKDCKVENTTVKGTSYDFDICGMVAWVYEEHNDKVAFEGNNVVKDVTLYIPAVTYNMCAKIYHNGETAYDEAANVTVSNVNVVIAK